MARIDKTKKRRILSLDNELTSLAETAKDVDSIADKKNCKTSNKKKMDILQMKFFEEDFQKENFYIMLRKKIINIMQIPLSKIEAMKGTKNAYNYRYALETKLELSASRMIEWDQMLGYRVKSIEYAPYNWNTGEYIDGESIIIDPDSDEGVIMASEKENVHRRTIIEKKNRRNRKQRDDDDE